MKNKPVSLKVIITGSLLLLSCYWLQAQPTKRLYIAADDHTDYMWSADEAAYDSAFVHMLDFYLHEIDATRANPPDFQMRYNCDGSYWLRAYQKYRSPPQFSRLVAAIRSGHISAPLNMLVNCYGAQPAEAVIRGMYYASSLERKYGLRFTMAGAMENNTLPLGLSSLWAGAGAKYSWKGVGGYGTQLKQETLHHRRYPLYQFTGLDGSSVLMKWYPVSGTLGGYAECRVSIKSKMPIDTTADILGVINRLDKLCVTVSPTSAYPYKVAGAFGFGHDDIQTYVSTPFVNAAQQGTTPLRRVRVSNEEDFFKDVEKTYPKLPVQSVSFGNEWDILCASMNETTAQVRRAVEKLRSAEALAAVASLQNKTFLSDLTTSRNQAWEALGMYWEHNWTADGPVKREARAAWQIKLQQNLTNYVDTLYNRSAAVLGRQLKSNVQERFFVFNPLSWHRTDVADLPYNGAYPVKVMDVTTGKEVASQLAEKVGKLYLRILAEDIPSVGYKVFEIRQGNPASLPAAAAVSGSYISNKFHRVKLSPSGAITGWYDSIFNSRQLVRFTDGKYVNDLGSTDVNDGDSVMVENVGPVSVTLKAVSQNPVLHTVRLTLFANSPRIEIEDSIQANFSDVKTWAFSFNLNNPTTRHEELGAVLTVKKEADGGNYSNQNARYDWHTFNHFASLSENQYGIILSNLDCSFFKLGKGTVDSLWETAAQLNALAGGRVDKKLEDGGILGIPAQYGNKDFLYHFALTTHHAAFDAAAAMRFSMEHQNPLVATPITGQASTASLSSFSLLTISDPSVLLWSIKPAEGGLAKGLVARCWNMGSAISQPVLRLQWPIRQAWKVSSIETDQHSLPVSARTLQMNFRPYQMNTYRFIP